MAFIAQNLSLIVQPVGSVGLRMFSYKTDDSQATLEAADYIPNASDYGVREDDLIFVSQIAGGADPYVMVVASIDALDNATLMFGDSLELGPYATEAEAIAGVIETRTMNPLRTKQAITSYILDEDDFASDSATKVPSQQSAKAYVDHRLHDRSSRADAIANFHPITAPDFIRTAGYAAAGDGGGALYKKAVAEPSHAGKLSITLAGATTAWYEIVPERGRIDARQIGCVMDGAISINDAAGENQPTGTGLMSGTDNYTAMRNAYAVAAHFGVKLWLAGFFYVRVPDGSSANVIEVDNLHLAGPSAEECGIYFGGSQNYTTVGQSANTMIGSAERYAASYTRTLNDYFIVENVTLRGAWWYEIENGNRTWTAPAPYRVHGLCPHNYRHVRVEKCRIWDVMGFGIHGKSCLKMEANGNDLRRVCGDGIRGEDVSDFTARDNFIDSCDDDAITNPADDGIDNTLRPRRQRCLVTGNTVINSEGILILGPANCIVTNNKMVRCYGTGLSVYAQNADVADMGEGGFRSVIVSGNVVEDHLEASNRATPPDATWSADTHAFNINGSLGAAINTTYPLGESLGSDSNPPWFPVPAAGTPWGGLHLNDAAGSTTTAAQEASGYRGYGVVVTGNIAVRTLPAASTYSVWGYGKRFTRWGYDNPVVAETNFATNGFRFGGKFDSAVVIGNEIKGYISGAGIFLDDCENDMGYKSFLIKGNTIKDCRNPIYADPGAEFHQDITIEGNILDADPRRIQAERVKTAGNHGKWSTVATTAPACINMLHARGLKILGNVLMNAANPWHLEGAATETVTYNTLVGNVGVVDFVNGTAASTTDAANRGLGRIPRVSPMITYEVRDLDPANYATTYNQRRAGMTHYNAAMPGSGYYVIGHKVDRTTGGYWQRLTTGTAHVVATDWVLVS